MTTKRKLAAILFADIAGYTKQLSEDEVSGLDRRRRVETLVKGCVATHNGHLVKTIGDAVMVEFASAVEAVSCALQIQDDIHGLNSEMDGADLKVRVGVHVGDVVEEDDDLYGNGVNIAQRVQEAASPGSVCITREVFVQIRPILKLRCEPVRVTTGKPMPEPVEVFEVTTSGQLMPAKRFPRWLSLRPILTTVGVVAAALFIIPRLGPGGPPPGPPPNGAGGAQGPQSGGASSQPGTASNAKPFAVVGGTYAAGDKITIGGERLGTSGTVFLGGARARTIKWADEEVVAIVPSNVRSGSLPVVVSPGDQTRIEAGTITVAPSGEQLVGASRARRQMAEMGMPPEPPDQGQMGFGYQDMRQRETERALARADARLRENPNHPAANAMKAIVLLEIGQKDKARPLVTKALSLTGKRGGYVRALALLSSAMLADRDGKPLKDVSQMYRQAVQAEPDPLTFFAWANTLYERKQTSEARDVFRQGLRTGGNSSRALGPYVPLADKLGIQIEPPTGGPGGGGPPFEGGGMGGGMGGDGPLGPGGGRFQPRGQANASSSSQAGR